jgi:hypothetical protein
VEHIPVSKEEKQKRADLKASLDNEVLIIEAKSKEPHQGYFDLLKQVQTKGYGSCTREEIAWNALSSVVEGASHQLIETPAPQSSPRILWVSCLHDDWRFVLDTFQHRLYGDVDLNLFRDTSGLPEMVGIRRCFYYNGSDFLRYQIVDAAILAGPTSAKVLVNELGNRVEQLRLTTLYMKMKEYSALCDPKLLRESGEAIAILDTSLRDQNAKWQYLLDKYGFKTSIMHNYSYKALLSI